jgi:hypothetical protein
MQESEADREARLLETAKFFFTSMRSECELQTLFGPLV